MVWFVSTNIYDTKLMHKIVLPYNAIYLVVMGRSVKWCYQIPPHYNQLGTVIQQISVNIMEDQTQHELRTGLQPTRSVNMYPVSDPLTILLECSSPLEAAHMLILKIQSSQRLSVVSELQHLQY